MANDLTTANEIALGERGRRVVPRDVQTRVDTKAKEAEALKTQAEKDEAQAQARLSTTEKAAFSLAAAFSVVILIITLMLTIVGFIFSPITHTLVFGLLMGATGLTTYVIYRGGRCYKSTS